MSVRLSSRAGGVLLTLTVVASASCGGGERQTPAERAESLRAARADSVQAAARQFDPSVFDTITWASDGERWERGGVVWSFSCQKCHGADGRGGGEIATQYSIEMPDLTAPDWPYAGKVDSIRRQIFVGHESEMPSWGLVGLTYRDVDAAAHYINDLLRSAGDS